MFKNKRGQMAVEYLLTMAMFFTALIGFYVFYSRVIPHQFDDGAQVILTVYDGN